MSAERRIPDATLAELRRRSEDCADVARWLNLRGGRGRRWFCPACQTERSKTPDLSTPARGGWLCFKCGAKGGPLELVGLAQGRPVQGAAFREVAEWLAERVGLGDEVKHGEAPKRPNVQTPKHPSVEEARLPPGALQDVWDVLAESGNEEAATWLDVERGIPPGFVESGFAYLDAEHTLALPWPSHPYKDRSSFHEHTHATLSGFGPAVVAPLRNAATGQVEALNVRELSTGKRRTLEGKRAPDGTPRGYGFAGAALRADTLVLTEGMADTFAAEALLRLDAPAVVVGAVDAHELPVWGRWLAERLSSTARVVVLRHFDGEDGKLGVGQTKAAEAVRVMREAGKRAEHFPWPAFARALHRRGLDVRGFVKKGFDLADVLEAGDVLPDGHGFVVVAQALREVLGFEAGDEETFNEAGGEK